MIADVSGKCYIHCPRRDVLVASIPNNSVDYLESFFVLANHMMHVIRAISNLTLLHASVGETAQHLMERPWLFALSTDLRPVCLLSISKQKIVFVESTRYLHMRFL